MIPVEVHESDKQISLDVLNDYIGNPSDHDMLVAIQEHYDFSNTLQSLNNTGQSFYLGYRLQF